MGIFSWSLLIGALNGVALTALVLTGPGRRMPRLLLAALTLLVSLRLVPFILGYAGVYDAHPWLTFAPFDFSLAYGPLLWGYIASLTSGRLPARWSRHLLPAGIQLVYWLACFSLPLSSKWAWYIGPHLHVVAPIGAAFAMLSASVYLIAGWRSAGAYRTWLDQTHANHEDARLVWVMAMLAAFGLVLCLAVGFAVTSWFVQPLDYFARFPLMIAFAVLTYALGLLGWRHATVRYPPQLAAPVEVAVAVDAVELNTTARDYRAQAQAWKNRIQAGDLWRDETLDLAALARHLGTSQRTLSRTLSEGLGQTFREFLGRIRAEAAAIALADPSSRADVLTIAYDVGFNSKASFNRAFRRYIGCTPTAWRRSAHSRKTRQSYPAAETAAIRLTD